MDVVALPSHTEAFGRTVIEALAMARPVVSVAVEGILDLIRHDAAHVMATAVMKMAYGARNTTSQ